MSKFIAATVSCVLVFGLALSAHGGGISVSFDGSTGQLVTGATGVVSLGNWNNVTNVGTSGGSLSSLKNDAGTSLTGVDLTLSWLNTNSDPVNAANTEWNNGLTITTPARQLFQGMLDGNTTGSGLHVPVATSIRVTNVPYAAYDVYVYHMFATNHAFDLSVNGGAVQRARPLAGSDANADSFVLNDGTNFSNYTLFSNVSGSTLTILANNKALSSTAIVGFQIVEGVPEPSGAAIVGMAAIALGFIRRRFAQTRVG